MGLGLSSPEVGLIRPAQPDFGQIHYMVDSDYRTAAQGWSRADRTGPLDLYEARKSSSGGGQYVYRTGDYSSDAVAIQAAIDAQVDFRGDVLFYTPGAYSVATALVINVPDARWLAKPVSHPTLASASLTAAVAAAFAPTAAADRMELGYLTLIPQTAQTMWNVGAVSGFHGHDLFYNTDGIAASTDTVGFVFATASEFINFDRNYVWVDGAQGPWIRCASIVKGLTVRDFQIYLEAGSWAVAINLAGIGAADFDIGPGSISGGGTALTSLITIADKTKDTTHGYVHEVFSSTVGPAVTALCVAVNAAEADIAWCRRGRATDTAEAATADASLAYTG